MYILKKITKKSTLHPTVVVLKWDHVSDLKLAGSDFITQARIDLPLGTEVFTRIFHDGRWTGPQGTPSTINTCFGWVLLGKIQCSDVVDMANMTLEQEVMKDLTGLRRFYVALLTAAKNMDLWYL